MSRSPSREWHEIARQPIISPCTTLANCSAAIFQNERSYLCRASTFPLFCLNLRFKAGPLPAPRLSRANSSSTSFDESRFMFRLDYISCALTISAAILLGRKRWQGWLVAGINSILICDIAVNTSQTGFIPANVFCVALYAYNILGWRKQIKTDRQLDTVDPKIHMGATPEEVFCRYGAVCQLPNRGRGPTLRPETAETRLEAFCCERAVASCGEGDRSANIRADMWNLMSCPGNPS